MLHSVVILLCARLEMRLLLQGDCGFYMVVATHVALLEYELDVIIQNAI